MNWLATIFLSMFASNALLTWGFGLKPGLKADRPRPPLWLASLLVLNLIAAILLWLLSSFVLGPLRLGTLVPLVYILLIVPSLRLLSRGLGSLSSAIPPSSLAGMDELSLSSLVFGISLLAVRGGGSLGEGLLAALTSALGWWGASALLGAIGRRTDESPIPPILKGGPSMLLSAALVAMTISLVGIALGQGLAK